MTCRRSLVMAVAVSLAVTGLGMATAKAVRAQTVTRGPYLQIVTQTSAAIRWRTDIVTDSRVAYGSAPGSLAATTDDAPLTTEHIVQVTGLTPNTQYFYSVGTTAAPLAGDDANHWFYTAPKAGKAMPTRVWVIGDSGTANANARAVRDAYLAYTGARRTNVWLMLGDNAYTTGTDAQYQAAVFDTYPTLLQTTPLWPTRGNHDFIQPGPDYFDIFSLPMLGEAGGLASGTEAYYSFDFANIHFICLDSQDSDRSPTGPMLTWLTNDLLNTQQDWIIAYWHHPPYSKGSHDSDNVFDSAGRMRDMRENALPILEAGGVDLVLTGHSHSYERSVLLDGHYGTSDTLTPDMVLDAGDGLDGGDGAYRKSKLGPVPNEGAVYAVAGSSGKIGGGALNHPVMVVSLNVLGSMALDFDGNRMDAVFLESTGVLRDAFTMVKGSGAKPKSPAAPLTIPFFGNGNCVAASGGASLLWPALLALIGAGLAWRRRGRKSRRPRGPTR